ncbi:hypothetical protein OAI78_02450 [Rhodobiaceae bacterium]|nr:hypothetical protein [Rhodobiaceae bacterium]
MKEPNKLALKYFEKKYGKNSETYKRMKKVFERGEKRHEELYGDDEITIVGSIKTNPKK